MPESGRPPASASLLTASFCAFAIIATQVAGKAARDVIFLTNFPISALPLMLIGSALLSIAAVPITSRALTLFGPVRVMPPFFFASALLLAGEWILAIRNEALASVIVYAHVAVIGSILISGFWSMINEHFDPRSARRSIARIAGGATLGGLVGGFLADSVGTYAGTLWVLPIIAVFHLACAFLLPRLTPIGSPANTIPLRVFFAPRGDDDRGESGFRILRRVGYLRNLAIIVLLGNVAATLIDFLFKARATETFPASADLMGFFAVYYTVVSLGTLVVQAVMTRRVLERVGIANAVATRPAVMTLGGLVTLPFMGVIGLGILRGLDAVVHSSLFRSGYEILFTPVSPDQKRRTRTLIDVGADRMGDVVGGGIVRAVILLPAALSGRLIVVLAMVASAVGFIVARALHRGYVRALETSLLDRADALAIPRDEGLGMRTTMMESLAGLDMSMSIEGIKLGDLRKARLADPDDGRAADNAVAPAPARAVDPEIASLIELKSGDAARVRGELRRTRWLSPAVAAHVTSLLAWDEVTGWVSRALAKAAPAITGQLIDRLLDVDEDFAVRRRIPSILATCETPRAFNGLVAALSDPRFEVRFQSGRALARLHRRNAGLTVEPATVFAAVLRETSIEKPLWDEQRLLDEPAAQDPSIFVDEALRTRTNRSMEHVFTLLSLVLPDAPLHIAFKGLLTDDAVLRGTSLEYLESVLPRDVWDRVRPFFDDRREKAALDRPSQDILEDLLRSGHSIDVNLAEIRKRTQAE